MFRFDQVFLNSLVKFLSRIVTHLFLSVVDCGGLNNNRKITARTDRNAVAYHTISEEFRILFLQPQPVVLLISVPVLKCNNQIDILRVSYGTL